MSKVLYVYEKDMPTVRIMRDDLRFAEQKGGLTLRVKRLVDVTCEDVDWCDVLLQMRPNAPYSATLAKMAHNAGCFVVSFYDDDLYDLPEDHPNARWRRNSVIKTLKCTDAVMTSSPYIGQKYAKYTENGKRYFMKHMAVDSDDVKQIAGYQEDSAKKEPVKLVYAANAGHVGLFNQFILPIMPKLCQRYAGEISMTFMGVRPELSDYESAIDIQYLNSMPMDEYRQRIKDGNYDIGLSPLVTTEFTKCKYFNKFIEYSIAGIVGVYSNTEPYTFIVQDGVNGFLVDDNPDAWFESLCRVIDDAQLRDRCICEAQRLLLEEFNPERLIEAREKEMPEMKEYHAKRTPCAGMKLQKMIYRFLCRPFDKAYIAWFYLRKKGIFGFIQKFKTHMRERHAYAE